MNRKPLGSILLNRARRDSLQSQLTARLKSLIQSGSIEPGDPLPSSRELATDLNISRNTVLAAYDQLVSEGYLDSRPRSGLFVAESLAGNTLSAQKAPLQRKNPAPRPPARAAGPVPFRPCQPDVRLFPLALWNRLRGRALKAHGAGILNYQSRFPSQAKILLGLPVLQRALAAYLRDSRGVRCSPEQIAVTTGSQQALYLLAQLLLKPNGGRTAFIEDPGYFGARTAFTAAGAQLSPLPVDAEGIIPPSRLAADSLVYTTPSRQFPTGACLPVARRLALIKLAHASGAWIVEDDYDSEFRYARAPLPSLHSLDPSGRVIYVGSMSKALFPSLRIGYVVLPPELIEPFGNLRSVVDDHGPLVDQATLAEFLSTGSFYSHIRRCRKEYAARLDTFLSAAVALNLPLEFPHTDGGMNLLGTWKGVSPVDDRAVSSALEAEGFDVPPVSCYAIEARVSGLLFGFTAFDHSAIRGGLRRLASLLG